MLGQCWRGDACEKQGYRDLQSVLPFGDASCWLWPALHVKFPENPGTSLSHLRRWVKRSPRKVREQAQDLGAIVRRRAQGDAVAWQPSVLSQRDIGQLRVYLSGLAAVFATMHC